MRITDLKTLIDDALARGIDPDCAVVVDVHSLNDASDWAVVKKVVDPSVNGDCIWFTLITGEEANDRFTPGHFNDN